MFKTRRLRDSSGAKPAHPIRARNCSIASSPASRSSRRMGNCSMSGTCEVARSNCERAPACGNRADGVEDEKDTAKMTMSTQCQWENAGGRTTLKRMINASTRAL